MSSRDMCISPALLDYLEQTLEPFDMIKNSFETASNIATPVYSSFGNRNTQNQVPSDNKNPIFRKNPQGESVNDSNDSKALQKNQETASYFPVEVVVFVSMLPSCIRFTCLPQSTMECLLKLPTLELVFSTYKIDSTLQEKLYNKLNYDMYGRSERGVHRYLINI